MGWLADSLKVAVTAPAQAGKANNALKCLLAEVLQIDKKSIAIIAGQSSARKMIKFNVVDINTILEKLNHPDMQNI